MDLEHPHAALEAELLRQINDSALSPDERAWLRCELAKRLEEAGSYEAAREAMGDLWSREDFRPQTEGLDRKTAGEVLLRVGVLVGWIGSTRAAEGAQERAKNLIIESVEVFESLGERVKAAEALTDLAYCYWREGAFDEARVVLKNALDKLGDEDGYERAVALLRSAMVERSSTRYSDALRIHRENAPLVERIDNHALKGKFHNEYAIVLEILGAAEHRQDYIDRALVEYTAAGFHFEQAGHVRYHACTENNLGMLFFAVGRYGDSHEHLDRARRLLERLRDSVHVAQVDETRARVLLAEGREAEAERVARGAVSVLEKSGEQHSLVEALISHGVALARTGRFEQARTTLSRATVVAEQAGDREGAGLAALTTVEELGEQLSADEQGATFERAADLLSASQHAGLLARLSSCARRVLKKVTLLNESVSWEGYSLRDAVRRYEERMISRALRDASGVVSHAARLLGFKHHQALVSVLNNRYRHLLPERTPIQPRRKKVRLRGPRGAAGRRAAEESKAVRILYLEDNRMVRGAVDDTLKFEGWEVDAYETAAAALAKLPVGKYYDLIITDYDMPGMNGVEFVRRVRATESYRRTPIIMLTASPVAAEAYRAGVNMVLRKPEGLSRLANVVRRMLPAQAAR